MQMEFPMLLCPSDPYRGLTTDWGAVGRKARIMHYYAVQGTNEGSTLQHEDQTTPGTGTYGHCNRHDGMFYNDSATRMGDLKDGTSQTAMLCEVWGRSWPRHVAGAAKPGYPSTESSRGMNLHTAVYFGSGGYAYTPNSNHMSPWRANSFHPGGVHVLYADGSVHFVNDAIDKNAWFALATIAGHESISASLLP